MDIWIKIINNNNVDQKETIEGNRLIAEFLGYKVFSKRFPRNHGIGSPENDYSKDVILEKLRFHSEWNKLMPVVEKIESIKDEHHGYFGVHITSNSCTIQATNFRPDEPLANPPHYFGNIIFDNKIISTWMAIVNFIKWYNSNNR